MAVDGDHGEIKRQFSVGRIPDPSLQFVICIVSILIISNNLPNLRLSIITGRSQQVSTSFSRAPNNGVDIMNSMGRCDTCNESVLQVNRFFTNF